MYKKYRILVCTVDLDENDDYHEEIFEVKLKYLSQAIDIFEIYKDLNNLVWIDLYEIDRNSKEEFLINTYHIYEEI